MIRAELKELFKENIDFEVSEAGVIIIPDIEKKMDVVYKHPEFQKWENIISERLKYYTEQKTVAGIIAHLSYNSIKSFNKIKESEYILDIGCGDGSQTKFLDNRKNYIGVDKNLERLEILKKRYPECIAIYCDATNLPFKDQKIDYIHSSNAFEHLWYLKEVVFECYRCLNENGKMKIVFPTEGGLWNLGRRFLSKPHYTKKFPDIDFEIVSHIEHCNNATQIIRTLETFFEVKNKFLPTRIPSIFFNVLVEVTCTKSHNVNKHLFFE